MSIARAWTEEGVRHQQCLMVVVKFTVSRCAGNSSNLAGFVCWSVILVREDARELLSRYAVLNASMIKPALTASRL